MSNVPLAHKYSAETYDQALSNLVERWKQEGGDGPIKYDEAAVGMDASTVSVALKFLGEIGLLEVPKAGSYIVPEAVVDYRTKMGDVEMDAKREVAARLDDYPLYKETKFMLGLNDFTVDELAEEVSGTAAVAADKSELSDVKRSLRILAALGLLDIDDEGRVSIPADLDVDSHSEPDESEGTDDEVRDGAEERRPEPDVSSDTQEQPPMDQAGTSSAVTMGLTVDMDISLDVTDMEAKEIREKLGAINDALGKG